MCVLQQPKYGEPLYAQVNLEKKKKRQYELGVGGQTVQGAVPSGEPIGASPGVGLVAAGSQWVTDCIQDTPAATVNVPPNSNVVSAGDSWV